MSILHEWAAAWSIPAAAVADLQMRIVAPQVSAPSKGVSESAVQAAVRLEAGQKRVLLWRKRRATAKITRHGGSLRVVTVVKSPDGTEKTEIREETDRRDISEPVMHSPHRVFAGAFFDIEKSEARPVVGFSFRNRVDVGIAPVRIERTYKFEFQPTVMIALRF